jgi:hypothetical protein
MSPEAAEQEQEQSWAERMLETVPDLGALAEQLRTDPGEVIPPPAKVRALVGTARLFGDQRPEHMTAELERERAELLQFARQAVEKLRQGRGLAVPLTAEEQRGAAAMVTFITRPALLVQNGTFVEPPAMWKEDLDRRKSLIERTLRSVGRIEIEGDPLHPWVGTGWVVADGLLITNRHVVKVFAAPVSQAAGETRWRIREGLRARIDFGEEWQSAADPDGRSTFDVPAEEPIRVHPVHDLALVPVKRTSRGGTPLPERLLLAANGDALVEGTKVYVAGYPAVDDRGRELSSMYRLFASIFDVKRLQPGQIMQVLPETGTLLHDCSTLGGNSGSCVVDLRTGRVAGLHYAGFHRHANLAIAFWQLVDDPLLREAGVRF